MMSRRTAVQPDASIGGARADSRSSEKMKRKDKRGKVYLPGFGLRRRGGKTYNVSTYG